MPYLELQSYKFEYSLQVTKLIFLAENALAILLTHMSKHSSKIGSPQVRPRHILSKAEKASSQP